MVVVAIIAVLAAVVIPGFFKESRRAKSDTEVSAMFAELGVRQEQYKMDNNVYLSAPACPATTSPAGTDAAAACLGAGTPWTLLRVQPPQNLLRCTYEMTAGTSATSASNPGGFVFTSPPTSWYYILATCNMDGEATTNATYFTSSVDTKIQSKNVGR